MRLNITRRIEIDAGHRLLNHEGKCRNLHGHRYRFDITVEADRLDEVGRVIDFGKVKDLVGGWLDAVWDHGFLVQEDDPLLEWLEDSGEKHYVCAAPPTIENMVVWVLQGAADLLMPYGIDVVHVRGYETPNCFADVYVERGADRASPLA